MQNVQIKNCSNPRELHRLLGESAQIELIDVRTLGEFSAAHVPGARLIPLDRLDAEAFLKSHAQDKPVYILCQTGARARKAVEKFERAGFKNCVLVEGGTQAWIDAGLPVHRGKGKVLPLMRQVQIVVGLISATGAALALTISVWFALIPLLTGLGLLFAGVTGFCGMALLLAKMPWNQSGPSDCDCG